MPKKYKEKLSAVPEHVEVDKIEPGLKKETLEQVFGKINNYVKEKKSKNKKMIKQKIIC